MERSATYLVGALLFGLGACAPAEGIDEPQLELYVPPPAPPGITNSTITMTNGAGKPVFEGVTNADGDLIGDLPPLTDYDGTLNIQVTRPDGTTVTDTVTHEPGKAVKLTFHRSSQFFTAETVEPIRIKRQFSVALDGAYSLGSANTRQEFNGNKESGSDASFSQGSAGIDFRWNPCGCRLFGGFWGRYFFGEGGTGLNIDNHPGNGKDTTVQNNARAFVMPYVGYDFVDPLRDKLPFRFSGYVGGRLEFAEIEGNTDESGGGGINERFSDNKVYVAPTVGIEFGFPIPDISGDYFDVEPKIGFAVDYIPELDVNGTSTNNFDYKLETESAFRYRVLAGVQLRF